MPPTLRGECAGNAQKSWILGDSSLDTLAVSCPAPHSEPPHPTTVTQAISMRFGLSARLFVSMLALSLLVAVAVGVAARHSFTRGFLGYLNEQDIARMERLIPVMAQEYRRLGSWDDLRNSRRSWFRLLRSTQDLALPPGGDASELTGIRLRVSLLDAQRRFVVGNAEVDARAILRPVIVDGETVGHLAMIPIQSVTGGAELRLESQQRHALWLIIAFTVPLAALMAMLLSQTFLAPIKRIASAMHRLAGGHHDTRVPQGAGRWRGLSEIDGLIDDFNQLAIALEKSERMRRASMADVAHELRTPLAVLRAELEALEDGVRPLTAEAVRQLQGTVATLQQRVDDLHALALSDAGALSYRMQPVDVGALLHDTVNDFADRCAQRRLLVDLHIAPVLPSLTADPARLRQLFANLLSNTLRYTDPGGRLDLRCTDDGDALRCEFQDSAPGVPENQLPRIFERFFRGSANSPASDAGHHRGSGQGSGQGSGLGLSICRNIAEAHRGSLDAQASPLGGLWLTLRLPYGPRA